MPLERISGVYAIVAPDAVYVGGSSHLNNAISAHKRAFELVRNLFGYRMPYKFLILESGLYEKKTRLRAEKLWAEWLRHQGKTVLAQEHGAKVRRKEREKALAKLEKLKAQLEEAPKGQTKDLQILILRQEHLLQKMTQQFYNVGPTSESRISDFEL